MFNHINMYSFMNYYLHLEAIYPFEEDTNLSLYFADWTTRLIRASPFVLRTSQLPRKEST